MHKALKGWKTGWLVLLLAGFCSAHTPQDAERLGRELTPMGANPKGNEKGTIPPYTGKILGAPAHVHYKGTGTFYPSAYAEEKPLFTITGQNYREFQANLTEGQIALFETYPTTFRMPVYPSKRDTRYSDFIHRNVKLNALSAALVAGGNGVTGSFAAVPFPFPDNGAELIWNSQLSPNMSATFGEINIATVYDNGETQIWGRQEDRYFEPFDEKVPREKFSGMTAKVMLLLTAPAREKGKVILVHEYADLTKSPRNAWEYYPGTRRVRRAPTIAYDFPDGPGGLRTVDDAMMFIGATDRFTWKMESMREIYVPYNNNALDDPNMKYAQLLTPHHINPDAMRYELHRCWVVVGELKPGEMHIYGKRRLFIDEDSWAGLLSDNYDRQGKMFRTNMRSFVNLYDMPGMGPRVEIYHDLKQKAYQANNLINEMSGPPRVMSEGWPEGYFTPSNLRMVGKR
ncbi:MAG TPA: DUF1329 domain-containing protein [Pseudomonadales bacterium]|nr:DUF1329 domain-containing protein [Pseudomonadales bacterium]